MGRKRVWGGSEYGAEARLGRKRVVTGYCSTLSLAWGGREHGAEGSMGRNGVWGGTEYGVQGTPRHTNLHLHPQATTFLSPPGGIYLIFTVCKLAITLC
jgi:hypothetical protein